MKKRYAAAFLCAVLLTLLCCAPASADTGPKPSVSVSFTGLGDELCYATLISETKSTGPWQAWDGTEENALYRENLDYATADKEIWETFVNYNDSDGFYFLQQTWQVNETGELYWGYYPPSCFKVLLYFPETGEFAVSDKLERYAFDSYFTVDAHGVYVEHGVLPAEKSYDYGPEIVGFLGRVVITVLIELLIALLFAYSEKRQLILLVAVNLVTQIVLNVILNVSDYRWGAWAALVYYVIGELVVTVIEVVVYGIWLNKLGTRERKKWVPAVYAVTANLVSFIGGRLLMTVMPWLG